MYKHQTRWAAVFPYFPKHLFKDREQRDYLHMEQVQELYSQVKAMLVGCQSGGNTMADNYRSIQTELHSFVQHRHHH